MSKSIVRRFLPIFGSKVIGFVALFLATPIIVRLLGSSRYGDYAFVLSILGILSLFVDAGVFDGIRKFLKESDGTGDWHHHVFSFYSRIAVALVSTTLVGIIVLVDVGVVQQYLGRRFGLYFILIGIVIASRQLFTIARSTLMGFDREDVSETLQVTNTLLFVACGLGLLFVGFGVPGLIAAKFIANIVTAGAAVPVISRYIDYSYLFRRTAEGFPRTRLLTFNFESVILFGFYTSIRHIDIILLHLLVGSTITGYYRAALTLAEFLWFIPRIVQTTLLHSTSELWAGERHEKITNIAGRLTRYTLVFTALLVIGLAALAEPTVTLYYGNEFEPAVTPLIILLPGALGFAIARPILAIGQGKGDLRALIFATAAASLINFVLNLVLIPLFGIVGAAVATSIGYLSMLVFHILTATVIGFNPLSDLRLPNVATSIVLTAGPIYLLADFINSAVVSLIVVPPVGFLIYSVMAVSTGAINIEELRELYDQVPF